MQSQLEEKMMVAGTSDRSVSIGISALRKRLTKFGSQVPPSCAAIILGICRELLMASSGAASLRSQLLRSAVPLVKDYGFTREALARSVLTNHQPSFKAHDEPLSDEAVSALFGQGDDARRTLIRAWLDEGLNFMRVQTEKPTLRQVLHARLAYNEPALGHIPEVCKHTRFPAFLFFAKSNTSIQRRLLSSFRLTTASHLWIPSLPSSTRRKSPTKLAARFMTSLFMYVALLPPLGSFCPKGTVLPDGLVHQPSVHSCHIRRC